MALPNPEDYNYGFEEIGSETASSLPTNHASFNRVEGSFSVDPWKVVSLYDLEKQGKTELRRYGNGPNMHPFHVFPMFFNASTDTHLPMGDVCIAWEEVAYFNENGVFVFNLQRLKAIKVLLCRKDARYSILADIADYEYMGDNFTNYSFTPASMIAYAHGRTVNGVITRGGIEYAVIGMRYTRVEDNGGNLDQSRAYAVPRAEWLTRLGDQGNDTKFKPTVTITNSAWKMQLIRSTIFSDSLMLTERNGKGTFTTGYLPFSQYTLRYDSPPLWAPRIVSATPAVDDPTAVDVVCTPDKTIFFPADPIATAQSYRVTTTDPTVNVEGTAATFGELPITVRLSGLPAGAYTFLAQTRNPNGLSPFFRHPIVVKVGDQSDTFLPPFDIVATSESPSLVTKVTFSPGSSGGGAAVTAYTVTATDADMNTYTAVATSNFSMRMTVNFASTKKTEFNKDDFPIPGELVVGTVYTFTVRASKGTAQQPQSGEQSAESVPSEPVQHGGPILTRPDPPTDVSASSKSSNTATVTLVPPTYMGGGALTVTLYTVSFEVDPEHPDEFGTSGPPSVTFAATSPTYSVDVGGLTEGHSYRFFATATNQNPDDATSERAYDASGPLTIVTPPVPSLPDAPTQVTATPSSAGVLVEFTAPVNTGDEPVLYYIVESLPRIDTAPPVTTTTTSVQMTGLDALQLYTFFVYTVTENGSSPASESTTPPVAPGKDVDGGGGDGDGGDSTGAIIGGVVAALAVLALVYWWRMTPTTTVSPSRLNVDYSPVGEQASADQGDAPESF